MRVNTEIFIKRAQAVHGDKYDYSKTVYTKRDEKLCIICPIHGEFWQRAGDHINGHGCPKCKSDNARKNQVDSIDTFIQKAKKVHGDKYDYSKVNYINSQTPVIIICPEHGEFKQKPYSHIAGHGCRKCYNKTQCSSSEQFITSAIEIHGNYYDYSKVEYVDSKTEVTIVCPKHGEFKQTPNVHLSGHGCPICSQSHGERLIFNILKKYNIPFKSQFKLTNDFFDGILYIDFFIKYNNKQYFIEYNGEQHYAPIKYFGGQLQFEKQQKRDQLLRDFCNLYQDKVSLLEISYKEPEENIENMILNFINYETVG